MKGSNMHLFLELSNQMAERYKTVQHIPVCQVHRPVLCSKQQLADATLLNMYDLHADVSKDLHGLISVLTWTSPSRHTSTQCKSAAAV